KSSNLILDRGKYELAIAQSFIKVNPEDARLCFKLAQLQHPLVTSLKGPKVSPGTTTSAQFPRVPQQHTGLIRSHQYDLHPV
ncbi:hypothetical protein M8J75_010839, partial [Diaphorina citri]